MEKEIKEMKEVYINGVKFVREKSKKKYEMGDILKYNGYEWCVIGIYKNSYKLLMKDVLDKDTICDIFDENDLDNYKDVIYSKDNSFDWKLSIPRKGLNGKFLSKFNKNELIMMKTNYDENKYSKDYVRLLTIRENEKIDRNILKCSKSNWLMSPYFLNSGTSSAYEFNQDAAGFAYGNDWVTHGYGLRPVINLKSDFVE